MYLKPVLFLQIMLMYSVNL